VPNSTTYAQWSTEVALLVSGAEAPSSYLTSELPSAIDYAEGRIYREFNFLSTIVLDQTLFTAVLNPNVIVPSEFIVVNSINIGTPASLPFPGAKRNQLIRVSKDFLDFTWPSILNPGVPVYFALYGEFAQFGPWPDNTYNVEFVGTQRPAPLSATNTTTFITLNMPDLFLAATMVHITGFMKNYGAQADDPAQGISWESQYQKLAEGVDGEELRKRYANTIKLPPSGFDNKRMMAAVPPPR
jgi:hypothetical protein